MSLRRIRHRYMQTLAKKYDLRQLQYGGPICLTCLKPVDSEELVEGYQRDEHGNTSQYTYCKVLYRCHGAEELVRFDLDTTDWNDQDLLRLAKRVRLFDPVGHKDEGSASVQVK